VSELAELNDDEETEEERPEEENCCKSFKCLKCYFQNSHDCYRH